MSPSPKRRRHNLSQTPSSQFFTEEPRRRPRAQSPTTEAGRRRESSVEDNSQPTQPQQHPYSSALLEALGDSDRVSAYKGGGGFRPPPCSSSYIGPGKSRNSGPLSHSAATLRLRRPSLRSSPFSLSASTIRSSSTALPRYSRQRSTISVIHVPGQARPGHPPPLPPPLPPQAGILKRAEMEEKVPKSGETGSTVKAARRVKAIPD